MPIIKKFKRTQKAREVKAKKIDEDMEFRQIFCNAGINSQCRQRYRRFISTVNNLIEEPKYTLIGDKDRLLVIIGSVIYNSRPIIGCTHYLIGSSQFRDLLRCSVTVYNNHQVQSSIVRNNRHYGKIAELVSGHYFKSIKTTNGKISQQLPFICAKPDFIIENPYPAIIEIKSTSDLQKAKQLLDNKNIHHQIMVSMELYKVDRAELWIFITSPNRLMTKLVYRCLFEKNVTIFTEDIIHYAIQGYIGYLASYLAIYKQQLTNDDINSIMYVFKNYEKNHRGYQSVNLPPYETSFLCQNVLPFYKPKYDVKTRIASGVSLFQDSEKRLKGIVSNSISQLKTIEYSLKKLETADYCIYSRLNCISNKKN